MATVERVTKKVYITGSAYTLSVGKLSGTNINVTIEVNGTQASSTVEYYVRLFRGIHAIDSAPRKGTISPQNKKSFNFTNVVDKGDLKVTFDLKKLGGSGGQQVFKITVPR